MTIESGYTVRGFSASLLHFERNKIYGFKAAFLTLRVSVGIKKLRRQVGSSGRSFLIYWLLRGGG